jgi:hypothetical protein
MSLMNHRATVLSRPLAKPKQGFAPSDETLRKIRLRDPRLASAVF